MPDERSSSYATAFLKQSDADLRTYVRLSSLEEIPRCHRLQFLQMACEKLAKARLVATLAAEHDKLLSHKYIATTFKAMIQFYLGNHESFESWSKPRRRAYSKGLEGLAREIEQLSPADKDQEGGPRPDNCEYPWAWAPDQPFIAPADYSFPLLAQLEQSTGTELLRLVRFFLDLTASELA